MNNYWLNNIYKKIFIEESNRYTALFYYVDQTLLVLSARSGVVSVASFATAIAATVGIASASISLVFSLGNGFARKLKNN